MTKTYAICELIDSVVDEYVSTKKKTRINFFKAFETEQIDRRSINEYVEKHSSRLLDQISELDGALNGDKLLVEAYAPYKKSEIRELKDIFSRFYNDTLKYQESKKIVRRKKPKTPEQLVKGLHLIDKPVTVLKKKLVPEDKKKIIGSRNLFLINVKTLDLIYITGKQLSCEGAKIINFNSEKSGIKKIKDFTSAIDTIKNSTIHTCSKNFSEMPNKKRKLPRTISPNYILVKVI